MAWNKPSTEQQPTRKNAIKAPSAKRGVIVGAVIIVALGALCVWMFSGGDDAPKAKADKGRGRIKEVTPAASSVHTVDPVGRTVTTKVSRPVILSDSETKHDSKYSQDAVRELNTNNVIVLESSGLMTPAEQVLAAVFTTEPGDMPPPLPTISFQSEADLILHIDKMYEYDPKDTDRQRDVKAVLNDVKKELDKYLRDGGDVNSFLKYYDDQLSHARELYLIAQREVSRVVNSEEFTPEQTIELIKSVNKKQDEQGIKRVRLTKPQLESLGITQEELED